MQQQNPMTKTDYHTLCKTASVGFSEIMPSFTQFSVLTMPSLLEKPGSQVLMDYTCILVLRR